MPYLKSSQITGLSPKAIDTTGFTQADSINLGDRTYTEHEVLLADAFSITGDVTISDNLILAKLSDDGNAITVTGDASTTRTISGSGSLEGSTFAQTPNADMTGMTGTIGSGVTFLEHRILQCQVVSSYTGVVATGNVGSPTTILSKEFTHIQANPTVYIVVSGTGGLGAHLTSGAGVTDDQGHFQISNSADGNLVTNRMLVNQGYANANRMMIGPFAFSTYSTVTVSAGASLTYYFKVWAQSANYAQVYINSSGSAASPGAEGGTTMAIYELQE